MAQICRPGGSRRTSLMTRSGPTLVEVLPVTGFRPKSVSRRIYPSYMRSPKIGSNGCNAQPTEPVFGFCGCAYGARGLGYFGFGSWPPFAWIGVRRIQFLNSAAITLQVMQLTRFWCILVVGGLRRPLLWCRRTRFRRVRDKSTAGGCRPRLWSDPAGNWCADVCRV